MPIIHQHYNHGNKLGLQLYKMLVKVVKYGMMFMMYFEQLAEDIYLQ